MSSSILERPGVKVFQEFVSLSPTLIRPVLQVCLVGEANQVEVGANAGSYLGTQITVAYPDLLVGSTVDTTSVEVYLSTEEAVFDVTTESGVLITTSGVTLPAGLAPTSTKVEDQQIDSVLAGTTFTDSGTDFFAAGVLAGDLLEFVTDATTAASLGVNVSTNDITGGYTVLSVTDQNTLVLDSALLAETNVAYGITETGAATGTILISYVAGRADGVGTVYEFGDTTDAESLVGPAVPENPLGLAAALALANTDRVVLATMVEDDTVANHQTALELLESQELYALVPLTHNTAIHQIYKTHVDLMSQPTNKRERIALINREILTEITYQDESATGAVSVSTFTDANATFITNTVPVGAFIELTGTPATILVDGQAVSELRVTAVISETECEILGTADVSASGLTYEVNSGTLSKGQQARALRSYAETFNDRRVVLVSPDSVEVSVSEEDVITGVTSSTSTYVEGYYACASVGAMVSALPAAQPFTTLPVAGFTGALRTNNYFSETQLGIIAAGGVMILIQEAPEGPLTIRHQLTTAVNAIQTRELSIVKAVDYSAKYIRDRLSPLVGRNNITPQFINNAVRTTLSAIIHDLVQQGVIGSETNVIRIVQSETQPDTLEISIDFRVLYPLNYINVTLLIS